MLLDKIKIEIKWGFLFSLMMLSWLLLEKLLGFYSKHLHLHAIFTNFIFIPSFLMYYLALRNKKNTFYAANMTYRQGFLSACWLTVVITLLSPLVQIIFSYGIAPEYFPNFITYATETGQMTKTEAESYFNLSSYIFQVLVSTPIFGLFIGSIIAFFVKNKK